MTFKTCAVSAGLLLAAIWPAVATSAQSDSPITVSLLPAAPIKAEGLPAPSPAAKVNARVTVPGAPTNVVAVAGDGSAVVSFVPPIDNGGSEITGYTVVSLPAGGVDFDADNTLQSHRINWLINGTPYTFTVVAKNSRGKGPASLPSNSVTPQPYGTFPATARGTKSAAIPFTINYPTFPPVTLTSVTVDPDDFAITESNCIPTPPSGSCTIRVAFAPMPDTLLGVVNGSLDVVADVGSLSTPMSGTAVAYSMSANPVSLAFAETTAGDNSANLDITLTNNSAGTAAIEGVQIAGVDFEQFSVVSSNCIKLLSSGTSCLTTVRFTPASAGSKSAKLRFSHAWTNFDVDLTGTGTGVSLPPPDAPTNVMAVAGDNKATVSFTPPENVGGGAITGYTVTSFPAGGVDSNAGNTATSHLVTGLSNGTSYTFTVVARNGFGTGPASAASNPVTPSSAIPDMSIGDVTVMEGDSGFATAIFSVNLDRTAIAPVTFAIATSNGTAQAGSDYVALNLTGQSIEPGQSSKTFNVMIQGDSTQEPDETFTFSVTDVSGATVVDGSATATITDDDDPALTISDVSIVEGDSGNRTALFSVNLWPISPVDVTYNIATANGTATSSNDYTGKSLSGQVIPAGSSGASFSVNVKGDTSVEADEVFFANISNVTGAKLADAQGLAIILNDDGVQLAIEDASITEGDTGTKSASITVYLDRAPSTPVTFDIATSDGDATAGSDYQSFNLIGQSIAAGQTSKSFDVVINGDTVPENFETFHVTVSNVSGAVSVDGVASITIINDDLSTISISDAIVMEGDSGTTSATFTVSRNGPSSEFISYSIATSDGTATSGSDYVNRIGTQTLVPGQINEFFTVDIIGDTAFENSESFFVNLENVINATVADGQGVGFIMDNDQISLTISGPSVNEGNSGDTAAIFTVRLSKPAPAPVTFDVTTSNGTAMADSDYAATSTSLTIPAGQSNMSFNVQVHGDDTIEPDETFKVLLSNVTGVTSFNSEATATIVNDDVLPPVTLSISDASIMEGNDGNRTLVFAVNLSRPASILYRVTTTGGTATPGTDYVALPPAGQFGSGNVFITIKGDTLKEDDETFNVVISEVSGAILLDGTATGTILNDDNPHSLSVSDISVPEGNTGFKTASFSISLNSPAPAGGVGFDIATRSERGFGNVAAAGIDYVPVSSTHMVVAEGEMVASLNVKLLSDVRPEADETFTVEVKNVIGALVAKAVGHGTILNDDVHSIASIQGNSRISPLLGQQATIQGVVTAMTRDGFFVQSAADDEDGNPGTSEGLFVRADRSLVPDTAIGQRVEADGMVRESVATASPLALSRTELVASDVKLIATMQPMPTPVTLDSREIRTRSGTAGLERYEGMRVAVPRLAVVGPVGGSIQETSGKTSVDGVFYGVPVGLARPFLEPGRHELDIAGGRDSQQPVFDGNRERLRIDSTGQRGAMPVAVDVGDSLTRLVGVLDDGAGTYSLLPDMAAPLKVNAGANPRPVAAPLATESLIGYLPLHRFFDAANDPRHDEPVMHHDAYALRLAKTAHVLCTYMRSPAIVAVSDIENLSALSDLAEASNSLAGNVLFPDACVGKARYRPILPEGGGEHGLNLGLLIDGADIKPGIPQVEVLSVTPLAMAEKFTTDDGSESSLFAQLPLLLRVRINQATGQPLALSLLASHMDENHAGITPTAEHELLQARREAQAKYLANFIHSLQTSQPDVKLALLGGFGASEFSDGHDDLMGLLAGTTGQQYQPDGALGRASNMPLLNLTLDMPQRERYSSVSEGNAQARDHVLASQSLAKQHRLRCEFARINADFGVDHADDFSLPMRISDRDPMVLFIGDR